MGGPTNPHTLGTTHVRYGVHALICLQPEVRTWVVDQAHEHVDWCRQFGIAVTVEDALSDVVDAEIVGFASRDWSRFGLACRWLGVDDFTASFRVESSRLDHGEVVEVVFRPSLWTWLVSQADGDELSRVVNLVLTNARVIDWESYDEVLGLVGDTDSFRRQDGPPDETIEACQRLGRVLFELRPS